MKVLFFVPYALWDRHFETDLEIILENRKAGHEIHVVQCAAELSTCDANPDHQSLLCVRCKSLSMNGMDLAGVPPGNRYLLDLRDLPSPTSFPHFADIEALKKYRWKDLNVGSAVASSFISWIRDKDPSLQAHQERIRKMLAMAIGTHQAIARHLDRVRPELVYLFNGRLAVLRMAADACRARGIRTFFHDRLNFDTYLLTEEVTSHDLDYAHARIRECARRFEEDPEASIACSKWFEERRAHAERSFWCHQKDQTMGRLPEGFDPGKRNFVIFNSSEDEFAVFEGWKLPYFRDQAEAIRFLVETVREPQIHFYLRVHPHLHGVESSSHRALDAIKSPNLTVIPAESPVDSYAMMEACEKSLSFGSTAGIEAVYWNRPSLLLGPAFYACLDACYRPASREEAVSLVRAHLLPRPREAALKYAYWIRRGWTSFRHIQPATSSSVGRVNGKRILPKLGTRILVKVADRVQAAFSRRK